MFPHQSLELVLGSRHEQPQAQIHVGEQRRERPTGLQRVLRTFLRRQNDVINKLSAIGDTHETSPVITLEKNPCGSVRVRIPPRGSDRVRSTG